MNIRTAAAYKLAELMGSEATAADAEAMRSALLAAGYTDTDAVPEGEWLRIMGEVCAAPQSLQSATAVTTTFDNTALQDAWWSWHDADAARWSPGEDPDEAAIDAERRCADWISGKSDDGPERA